MEPQEAETEAVRVEDAGDQKMGGLLRSRRKQKKLSLAITAKGIGISIGLLSQIERGVSSPSVKTLRDLCRFLDLPMQWLYEASNSVDEHDRHIIRRRNRRVMNFDDHKMIKHILTPLEGASIQIMEFFLEPGGNSGDAAYTHDGEEAGVVVEGEMVLTLDGREHWLKTGDAFQFRSSIPHRFANPGSGPARVIWVVSPPFY